MILALKGISMPIYFWLNIGRNLPGNQSWLSFERRKGSGNVKIGALGVNRVFQPRGQNDPQVRTTAFKDDKSTGSMMKWKVPVKSIQQYIKNNREFFKQNHFLNNNKWLSFHLKVDVYKKRSQLWLSSWQFLVSKRIILLQKGDLCPEWKIMYRYICMYTHTCVSTYRHTWVYAPGYICMHVCIYALLFSH